MGLIMPNPNAKGDGLDDELNDGDIVLLDEKGNEIRFEIELEQEIQENEIMDEKIRTNKKK